MYQPIPQTPSHLRVFFGCLLSFLMLMTPVASVGAATLRATTPPVSKTKVESPSTPANSEAKLFEPALAPLAPSITASMTDGVPVPGFPAGFDVDADGKADPGDKIRYTTTITNAGPDPATSLHFSGAIDANTSLVGGSIVISPLALNDLTYQTIGNMTLTTANLGVDCSANSFRSVLCNDTLSGGSLTGFGNSLGTAGGTVVNGTNTVTTTNNGTVLLNTDGTFVYNPAAGFEGSDTFFYTLTSATLGLTDTASVTINVGGANGMVWFVNSTGPAGTGRQANPFNSLAAFNGVNNGTGTNPASGDTIFLFENASAYTGPVTLLANQKLIGQDASASVPTLGGPALPSNGTPASTAGNAYPATNPTGTNVSITGTTSITLNSGNNLAGFIVGGSVVAITGTVVGNLSVREVTINSPGAGLIITTSGVLVNNGTFTGFPNISSSGGTNGISLTGVSGTLSSSGTGGVMAGATVSTFHVNGGTVSATYTGNITQGNNAAMVHILGGHSTGTITFQTGTLNAGNGTGLQFDNADGTYSFSGTTTLNGGDAGIDILNGSGGTFNFGATAITNPTGVALNVGASTGAISISGALSKTSAGRLVDFLNYDTGTANISGSLSCTTSCDGIEITNDGAGSGTVNFSNATKTLNTVGDTAVDLDNNDGGAINFTGGGLNIDTTSGGGFDATNGGTITVTGTGNTIDTTTGIALNVTNTTIGANDLTFESISSNGAPNGIVLTATGSESLTVTGTGGTCTVATPTCTGGHIQSAVNDGVALNDADNVSLTRMRITNSGLHGVSGTGSVNNFTFNTGLIIGAGDGNEEDALFFGTASTTNILGTLTVTDSVLSGFTERGLHVKNTTGALTINVTNTSFLDNDDTFGANAILVESFGTAGIVMNVTNSTFDNVELNSIQYEADGTGTNDVNIKGNVFTAGGGPDNNPFGGGIELIVDSGRTLTFDIQGNFFDDIPDDAILIVGEGNAQGRIGGDLAAPAGAPGAGDHSNKGNRIQHGPGFNGFAGDGIRLDDDGTFNAGVQPTTTWTILIKNNVIDLAPGAFGTGGGNVGDQGIVIFNRDHAGTLNVTVTNNTVTDTLNEGLRAFTADRDGAVTAGPTTNLLVQNNVFNNIGSASVISVSSDDQSIVCANITGNTGNGAGSSPEGNIFIDRRVASSQFNVPQASTAAISAANNGAPISPASPVAPTFNTACTVPLPTNAMYRPERDQREYLARANNAPRSIDQTAVSARKATQANALPSTSRSIETKQLNTATTITDTRTSRFGGQSFSHHARISGKSKTAKNAASKIAATSNTAIMTAAMAAVEVDLPDLPAGESIKVVFDVLVDSRRASYSAQGTVTATGITPVLTDDPDVNIAPPDPTVTAGDCLNAITVTSNADSGANTLRDALTNICEGGTISFSVASPISLTSGTLTIDRDVTINGPGPHLLQVVRNLAAGAFRPFTITPGNTVSISGLTIANGDATGTNGGAILNDHSNLTVTNSRVGGFAANGGGIYNDGRTSGAATLTVINSVVNGQATVDGGGIYNASSGTGTATLNITNSTLSNGQAFNYGGAVYSDGAGASATITNATITNNRVNSDNIASGTGGGLYINGGGAVILRNSIVALNYVGGSGTTTGDDIVGAIAATSTHNLVGGCSSCGLVDGTDNNEVGVTAAELNISPSLVSVGGGVTPQHALLVGSIALDAGNNAYVVAPPFISASPITDQRGTGFPRILDAADPNTTQTVDIGAFEARASVENIPDKSTPEDTPLAAFPFNVGDATTITGVTATSSNQTLVPDANLIITGSGSSRNLAITPAPQQTGTATITVTVSASGGESMVDTFVLTVTEVNDAPDAVNDSLSSVAEDSGVRIIPFADLLGNDTAGPSESGQTINVTNVSNPVGGTVIINGTNVEFTPTGDFNGAASFDYTITDNGTTNLVADPKSDTATASFTITEVNDPPTATNDTLTDIAEDSGVRIIPFTDLTGNDSEGPANESGQTLIVKTVSNPVGGTVVINGTNVEFTPGTHFHGAASFDYTVEDDGTTNTVADPLTSGTATVSFNITPLADTPSVTPNPAITSQNTQTGPIVIDRNVNDGVEITHFKITNIVNGVLYQNDGVTPIGAGDFITYAQGQLGVKFTPDLNETGTNFSFDVQASTSGNDGGLSGLTVTENIIVNSTLNLVVNDAGDAPDASLDGSCDTDTGTAGDQCTLRAAIQETNFAPTADNITFSLLPSSTISLLTPLDAISGNLVITGPGAATLTVQRDNSVADFRIFAINGSSQVVTISGLTLTNGRAVGTAPANSGGAIYNAGTLTVTNAIINANYADAAGGGISNLGTLTLNTSVVSANTAPNGAGIYSSVITAGSVSVTLNESTVSSNNGNGLGAGIHSSSGSGTSSAALNINNSTINGNTNLGASGGGIYSAAIFGNATTTLTIVNSTISGNSATSGGGIYHVSSGAGSTATATITNATIANNFAGTAADAGGGIYVSSNSSTTTLTLRNTLVALNLRNTLTITSDVSGAVDPASVNNLISDGTGMTGISNGVNGNQVGTSGSPIAPRLDTLESNGGPTKTQALLTGSPALDAGDNTSATNAGLTFDQRGVGFPRIRDAADTDTTQTVDIGAYEADPTVEDISDKVTDEDTALPAFVFHVGDASTPFDSITATSNDQAVIPDANVVISPDTASSRTLTITPLAEQNGNVMITVTVTRGSQSVIDAFNVQVTAVNDPPSFVKGANQTVGEDAGPQSVPGWATSISAGPANESTQTLTFLIQGNTNPGLFLVAPAVSSNGTLTYTPAANANGSATITLALQDSGGGTSDTSASQTFDINVSAVNDDPVNTVPGAQTMNQNGTLTFSSGNGNLISIADVDAGGSSVQVTLTATNGTFSLSGTSGLSFTVGDGTADPAMTFTGTIANINNALNGLTFTPTAGFSGSASLQIVTNDQGNTGSGGAKSDTDNINITVNSGGTLQFNSATFTVAEAAGPGILTVTRTGGTAGTATVNWAITGGTATSADYTGPNSGTLTFNDGVTSQTISIPIVGDSLDEADETLVFTLSSPGGTGQLGAQTTATLTITDDDAAPTLSINDVSEAEGNAGPNNFDFTVTLSAASGQTVTVNYITADGSATAPSDYASLPSTPLTFLPGETTKTVTVVVGGDVDGEPDENFFVNLSGATNATISDSQGQGTIVNDDASVFTFSAANYNTTESSGAEVITVTRTGDLTQAATVDYVSSDDSNPSSMVTCGTMNSIASSRCDFITAIGTLRFAAGEDTKTFKLLMNQDSYVEGPESLTLTLSNPTGGNGAILGSPSMATVLIDDDPVESSTNVIDETPNFVREHYLDFLNREPAGGEETVWVNLINGCPSGDTSCDRVTVSGSFFGSPEFQSKGYYATRFYYAAFGATHDPTYLEFMKDLSRLNGATPAETNAARAAFPGEFFARADFQLVYAGLSNADYVDALIANTGVAYSNRNQMVADLDSSTKTRAQILGEIVDANQFAANAPTFNRGYVLAEYFGYLRRNPEAAGFNAWLNYLNANPGAFRTMVNGFVNSQEYRLRFGSN